MMKASILFRLLGDGWCTLEDTILNFLQWSGTDGVKGSFFVKRRRDQDSASFAAYRIDRVIGDY